MKERLFIFGYYGWQNTGDDAMLSALLQELPELYPKAEFLVVSRIPVAVPIYVKDKVKFVKPAPIPAFWAMVKSSTFIVGGGTHMDDYGKRTIKIKNLTRLFALVLLARVLCNKVYFVGNGIGTITTTWGRMLAKATCHLASHINVRDKMSLEIVKSFGLQDKISLGFDVSAILTKSEMIHNTATEETADEILGVCVTSVFEQYYGNKKKDSLLISEIAEHLNQCLNAMPKLRVRLFIFKDGPRDDDVRITNLLKDRLQVSKRVNLFSYNPDPHEVLAQIAQCRAFIGMKYHSCLFAYLNNIPLLVVAYHPKCRALANEIGLPEHAVMSLQEILEGQNFGERLRNLIELPESFRATLPVSVAKDRARAGIKAIA